MTSMVERDKERVVKLLFELDRGPEAAGVYAEGPRREAIKAELRRLAGDPRSAVDALAPLVARADNRELPDVLAVLALAYADLGEREAARQACAKLERASANAGTSVDRFQPKPVLDYIDKRPK
jgi:hypothetical protein